MRGLHDGGARRVPNLRGCWAALTLATRTPLRARPRVPAGTAPDSPTSQLRDPPRCRPVAVRPWHRSKMPHATPLPPRPCHRQASAAGAAVRHGRARGPGRRSRLAQAAGLPQRRGPLVSLLPVLGLRYGQRAEPRAASLRLGRAGSRLEPGRCNDAAHGLLAETTHTRLLALHRLRWPHGPGHRSTLPSAWLLPCAVGA